MHKSLESLLDHLGCLYKFHGLFEQLFLSQIVRGARLTPERAVRVGALAGDIVLCFWARHLTLTVPLSTQVYTV